MRFPLPFLFFFLRWDFSVMNSGPVLYLIYLIFLQQKKRKKLFIVDDKALHLAVLGSGHWVLCILTCWQLVGWRGGENIWASFFFFAALFETEITWVRLQNTTFLTGETRKLLVCHVWTRVYLPLELTQVQVFSNFISLDSPVNRYIV